MSEYAAWIGRSQTVEDILTPALQMRWRATLDSAMAAETVPQGLHWCLCLPDAPTAGLGPDGHLRRDDSADSFLPPIPLPRRMWASSAVTFHAPLAVGMAVTRTSTVHSISDKNGSSGRLVFVEVDHNWTSGSAAVIDERQTVVYREAATGGAGPMTPGYGQPDLAAWTWHRELVPSEALLLRYSALTFNAHRIHYDRPYAVGEEGYRGLVVHGPLTASLLLELARRELGLNALKTLAFRGQSPAFVGEVLHLVGKQDGDAITLAALGSDGRTVMSAEAAT